MIRNKKKLYLTVIQEGKGSIYHWDEEKDIENSYILYYGLNSLIENINDKKDDNVIAVKSPKSGLSVLTIDESIKFYKFLKNVENNEKEFVRLTFPKNENEQELRFVYQEEKLIIEPLKNNESYVDNPIVIPLSEIHVLISLFEEKIFEKIRKKYLKK